MYGHRASKACIADGIFLYFCNLISSSTKPWSWHMGFIASASAHFPELRKPRNCLIPLAYIIVNPCQSRKCHSHPCSHLAADYLELNVHAGTMYTCTFVIHRLECMSNVTLVATLLLTAPHNQLGPSLTIHIKFAVLWMTK